MTVTDGFWKDKRVFITGHTGFKGSWLSLWLQRMEAELLGYSLDPPTDPSLFDVAKVGEGMATITADIRDLDRFNQEMSRFKPEIVFHLAAQPLVRESYADPVGTYSTNVMGTVNLLEAARRNDSVKVVVVVTSDKCYENREWDRGYKETDAMGGHDPYSNSKGCAELVTSAYRRSFFDQKVAVASARAGNVFGGGDWAKDRLAPDCIKAFFSNEPVVLRNPHSLRPWQHVLEPVGGYLLLAEKLSGDEALYSEGWNFGPADEDTKEVQWIAEKLGEFYGNGAVIEIDKGDHPHEAKLLALDCSKARSKLGWKPKLSLEKGLLNTIAWYRAFSTGKDMREFSLREIDAYLTRVE